jgi:hypothetical protein
MEDTFGGHRVCLVGRRGIRRKTVGDARRVLYSIYSEYTPGNPLGLIYTLNFSKPFNMSTNMSDIMGVISKAPNGDAANNFAPNYFDGAMLSNDDAFFLYGGLLTKTDSYTPPDAHNVLADEIYPSSLSGSSFYAGFLQDSLGDNITRYLAYGGGVSAPSEQKAWYFGGLRSRSWGEIYYPTINDSINPLDASDTLLTLDLSSQQNGEWTNVSLPSNIRGRGGVEVVWVPVGKQGILVALGGVVYPDFNNANYTSENRGQSVSTRAVSFPIPRSLKEPSRRPTAQRSCRI